jgi:hypothetical protein
MDEPVGGVLTELDDALCQLLASGVPGAQVTVDPRERAAGGAGPLISLVLYDVRAATDGGSRQWTSTARHGTGERVGPPLRLVVTYSLSVVAGDVRTEHALLSQALRVLHGNRVLPADLLPGDLGDGARDFPVETVLGVAPPDGRRPPEAPGRLAVDLRVLVTLAEGLRVPRGPAVRESAVRVARRDDSAGPDRP